jgi:hypothetical protein
MSPIEAVIAIAIEAVFGIAGAVTIRRWWPGPGYTRTTTVLAGMIGGVVLTFFAAHVPGIGHLVGHVETAADSVMLGIGGLTPAVLIGIGVSGLLGGAILMVALNLIRSGSSR